MSELYPELSEQGKEHVEILLNKFKEKMKKVSEEVISDFYVNISQHIESDHWINYRESILNGLKGYVGDKRFDWKKIREEILKEHREEIIKDLNQDLLEQIEELKAENKQILERRIY